MKKFLVSVLCAALALSAMAQYAKQGIRMLSNRGLSNFVNAPNSGAACYGYVSPSGREYALFCHQQGVSVVEITNPTSPAIVGEVAFAPSLWHEVVVLGQYAYAVSDVENSSVGVKVINLTNVDLGIVTVAQTYSTGGITKVHTIEANPVTNYVYLNGGSGNGIVALDCSDPANPVERGRWNARYVHDSQIVSYTSGPYAGKEIAFLCCGGNGLYIVDVTNKANMVTLSSIQYLSATNKYCHSGSLTPDKQFFLVNDEFDEGNALVSSCTTHVVNVSNLSSPTAAGSFTNNGNYIDHNSQLREGYLFLAAYRGGLRIYNAANPLAMSEAGYFDTYPSGNGFSYSGAWGTYAYFPSGNVIISDMQRGLFVVDPTEAIGLGAPLTGLALDRDTAATGGLVQARKADGSTLILAPNPKTRNSGMLITCTLDAATTVTPSTTLALQLIAKSSAAGTPVTLEAKVASSGAYEVVGTGTLGTSPTTINVTGLTGSRYVVSSTGAMSVRLTATKTGPVKSNFRVDVDTLKFTVTR